MNTPESNGYLADTRTIEGVECPLVRGCIDQKFFASGVPVAGSRGVMQGAGVYVPGLDTRVPSLAIVEFTVRDATRLAEKFARELVKVLDRGALVRQSRLTTQVIYRADTLDVALHGEPWKHGLRFTDSPSPWSTAKLAATAHADVFLDGAEWLDDRSPLTVRRADLPAWDALATTEALRTLVDEFTERERLTVLGSGIEPKRAPAAAPPTEDTHMKFVRQLMAARNFDGLKGLLGMGRAKIGA